MSEMPASFEEYIRTHDKPVLADFFAEWCGPCKMMAPILQQLAKEWSGRITVIKVDTDAKPALALKYNITGVPTMILFKNGAEAYRVSGAMPLARLKEVLGEFV